jgi:hypothetical protein
MASTAAAMASAVATSAGVAWPVAGFVVARQPSPRLALGWPVEFPRSLA